jgi:ribosomal protein S18 acetylase RimI-like enzyme
MKAMPANFQLVFVMKKISTRLAQPEDLDTLAPLFDAYRQFYAQKADLALAAEFIGQRLRKNESILLLAEDEQQNAIGFCQLYPTFCSVAAAPIHVLYDLFVTPAARQSGAGKALLLVAEQQARQAGSARMDLTTAKTNLAAQSLYRSLGWVRDEVFNTYSKSLTP